MNEKDYYRGVYGGWLGKNIGGTLGAPVEGRKELLNLTFYPVLKDGPLENDDLDLQLVSLSALEQYGPFLGCRELGQAWVDHVFFPFDEYGCALTNMRRGLVPPVAGSFNNPFIDCMGSPIRSEIWGMTAPGAPHVAARFAWQDASVDHAGGEGVYGEMFFAAIESAVFMEKDRDRLIETGLRYIPQNCRTAKAVQDLVRWHREGKTWTEARELILRHHGRDNFTDAPQNIAFTILGWLYGEDFEDAMLKSVNCGYDTDCTVATLGAILGMILGPEGLPEKWVKPVGDRVVVSPPIKGFKAPANLDELTRRTMNAGIQILAAWNTGIAIHSELPTLLTDFAEAAPDETVEKLWYQDVSTDIRLLPKGSVKPVALELGLDYGPMGPAIGRNGKKTITIRLTNHSGEAWDGKVALDLPKGWEGSREQLFTLAQGKPQNFTFEIKSDGNAQPFYSLAVRLTRFHDGQLWAVQTEAFTLVPANEWYVKAPLNEEEVKGVFGTNRIEWEKVFPDDCEGVYSARTLLHNPSDRKLRLIAASDGLVKVLLDGKTVIDCTQKEEFMPAYHRAPQSQRVELELAGGSYELTVEARGEKRAPLVYLLPVATREVSLPGPFYYYTDVLMSAD